MHAAPSPPEPDTEDAHAVREPDISSPDVFVHASDIIGTGYRILTEGERVQYELRQTSKDPEAAAVIPLGLTTSSHDAGPPLRRALL
ncbi:cold-shock protein [Kitasatospora sp. NPDC059827]|uniref:cold-shock protein n=1 Tax=Kitasatospora sp. NPDC059827 TaxID=3346964 RepID=UPI0036471B5F